MEKNWNPIGMRFIALLLTALLLTACSASPAETTGASTEATQGTSAQMFAEEADVSHLEALYEGRVAYHGDIHDHAATGGKSDGHKTLTEWKEGLDAFFMDFAGILDHKQTLHMKLPEWDNSIFIGGSEAAAKITDSKASSNSLSESSAIASRQSSSTSCGVGAFCAPEMVR